MPAADGGGRKPGRPKKDEQVVTHNPLAQNTPTPAAASVAAASTSSGPKGSGSGGSGTKVLGAGRGSSSASSSSSSSSSSNAYIKAQQDAARKARSRYLEDAGRLDLQAEALAAALGPNGAFREALDTKLSNVQRILDQQLGTLSLGFEQRWDSLDADAKNNEIAAADSSNDSDTNRARERASALSEVANQGGGESDALRAQLMSLRSWEANQGEVSRAYADSARSIQNSRIDLVNDTRTAMQNVWLEADADRAQLYNDYYAQQSEVYTSLGNVRGQQAEYLGMAKEQGGGKGKGGGKGSGGKGSKGGGRDTGRSSSAGPWPGSSGEPLGRTALRTSASQSSAGPSPQPGRSTNLGSKSGGGRGGIGGPIRGGLSGTLPTSGPIKDRMSWAERQSEKAYNAATRQLGRSYETTGLPDDLMYFDREIPETEPLASSLFQNARTTIAQKRPEGATLRKW